MVSVDEVYATATPGANPNVLLPIGEGSYEPLSSQAHMTGIRVEIRAAGVGAVAGG